MSLQTLKRKGKSFEISWSDLDPNGHVRHTSYSNYAVDVRVVFLRELGYTGKEFKKLAFGPIVLREFIEYRREAFLGDIINVNLEVTALSKDGMRWVIKHVISKEKKSCCVIQLEGAWLDLNTRKMITPPEEMFKGFQKLAKDRSKINTIKGRFALNLAKT